MTNITNNPLMTRREVEFVCDTIFEFMNVKNEKNANKLISCINRNGIPDFLKQAWEASLYNCSDKDHFELCRGFCRYICRDVVVFAKLSAIACNTPIDLGK